MKEFIQSCRWFMIFILLCLLTTFSCDARYGDVGQICAPRPNNWKKVLGERRCKTKCVTNDDCKHSKKRCICDLSCGWSCIHRNARCPHLIDLPNGEVQSPSDYTVGSTATFGCYEGFTLIGSAERKCQGNRKWSGVQPQCLPNVKCGPPPEVLNAYHSGPEGQTLFDLETLIHYTCANGFYRPPSGLPKAKCLPYNGTAKWFGPDVQCVARSCGNPGTLINGKQEGFDFHYTYSVKYSCVDGYELIGSQVRKCQADGSWSGREPHCRPVQCPKPPDPLHGKVFGTSLDYLARVTYSCDEGHRLVGQIPRVCQADRTWSGQDPSCEEIRCPSLGQLVNGYIQGVDTNYGAIVMFYCEEGAILSGSQFARCQKDGTWSSAPPKCLAACNLPKVENGIIRKAYGSEKISHDHQIEIQCSEKHELQTPEYARCNNGQWSHIPRCIPVRCKQWPRNIRNGYVMFINTDHDSKAKYMCKSGYRLEKGNETVRCRFGRWEGTVPSCEEILCEHPNDVGIRLNNGKIKLEGSMGTYEYKNYIKSIGEFRNILFECDKGFVLIGPKRATCVNGTWEPSRILHDCTVQTHTPLEDTHWAIAKYINHEQFQTLNRSKRHVGDTHLTMMNVHQRLKPRLKATENLYQNAHKPKRMSTNTVQKQMGSMAIGEPDEPVSTPSNQIYIPSNVESTTKSSVKQKIKTVKKNTILLSCPPLVDDDKRRFANIRLNPDKRGHFPDSSQVMVQCHQGYELNDVENALIVCINGTWLPRPPLCGPKNCQLPPIANAFFASQGEILNLGETIQHGNGAKMYCMRGFELKGNDIVECNLGKWLKSAGSCESKNCPVPYLRYGHYLLDTLPTTVNHETVLKFECDKNFFPNPVNEINPLIGEVYCNLGDILPHNPECNAEEGDPVIPPESTFGCRRPMDIEKAWIYRELTPRNGQRTSFLIDPYLAMYPNNTIVHYKCDRNDVIAPHDGFVVHHEASSVKCVNGDWFALLTPCADPDILPSGVSSNSSQITEIQVNGHKMTCRKPNLTEDVIIMDDGPNDNEYIHGNKLMVQCRNEANQKWVLKCRRGTWKNIQDIQCSNETTVTSQRMITKSCEYNPIHYRHVYTFYEDRGEPLTFKEQLPEGAQLVFRCNHVGLFQFMGSKKMICQNGNWKGSLPHCRSLRIPWKEGQAPAILYRAKDGDLSLSSSGEIISRKSSTLEIDCIFPKNKAQPRWDQTNTYRKYPQRWSNATLHSWEADSTDIFNDSMEVEVYRLTIYMARPEDSGVFFCVSPSGKRHSVKIRVIDIDCPPITLNDQVMKHDATKGTFFGSMVHFLCPTGHSLIGNVRIYCLEMGQWSNTIPRCSAVTCPPFSSNLHQALTVNISSREYQGVATFRCAPGFTLQGPPILQCTETGKWREPVPTCRAVTCLPPDIPHGANVQPEKPNYSYGEVVTFHCDSGYMLAGHDVAICTDGGQWSNAAADCHRFCRYPGKPPMTEITSEPRDYYFVREKLVFYCKSDQYKMIGKSVLECTPSGSWSNELPKCQKRMRRHRTKSQQT